MKKVIAVIIFTLAIPILSSASQVIEERGRCIEMRASIENFYSWKKAFGSYMNDYDSKSEQDRYNISQNALKKVMKLITDFSVVTVREKPNLTEAREVLGAVEYSVYSRDEANLRMKNALLRLSNEMDARIGLAQADNKDCDLRPVVINMMRASPSNNTQTGVR